MRRSVLHFSRTDKKGEQRNEEERTEKKRDCDRN